MSIIHHPSDQALGAFAAGTLDEGRALVVATHVATCPACRKTVRAFERIGGAALEDVQPAALAADALENTLAALSAADASAGQAEPASSDVPAPLSHYRLGGWRWIGPGIYWRPVGVPRESGTRVFMLKAAPGTKLPDHSHSGPEWTCVLQGAFRHQLGRYGVGDFDEADAEVAHQPVVDGDVECICVVALQGEIQLSSWLGRLIQPFVRF